METIEMFKTSDGEVFETEKEALRHEAYLELEEQYPEHLLYTGEYGGDISFTTLISWLQDNRKYVKELLKII